MSVRHHQNTPTRGTGGVFRHTQTNALSSRALFPISRPETPIFHTRWFPLDRINPNEYVLQGYQKTAFVDVSDRFST